MGAQKDRREEELSHQAEQAKKFVNLRPTPAYAIERYRRCKLWWSIPKECVYRNINGAGERRVLDFGCGGGEISTELAIMGATVTGIDISPDLIEVAKKRAEIEGVSERVDFQVRDIEESPFPEEHFDVVLCYAVLHHLDIRAVFPRLLSSLRRGGVAVIREPIALSPTLLRIRKKVPVEIEGGPLDLPLTRDDVKYLQGSLSGTKLVYFDLFARVQRLAPSLNRIGNSFWKKAIHVLLGGFDRVLLTLCPPLSRFCGTVVISGRKSA